MTEHDLKRCADLAEQSKNAKAFFDVDRNLPAAVWAENYARDVGRLLAEVESLKAGPAPKE